MAHPFEKLFVAALRKSSAQENAVLDKAYELVADGYDACEVRDVLARFKNSLIDSSEEQIVADALEAFDEAI